MQYQDNDGKYYAATRDLTSPIAYSKRYKSTDLVIYHTNYRIAFIKVFLIIFIIQINGCRLRLHEGINFGYVYNSTSKNIVILLNSNDGVAGNAFLNAPRTFPVKANSFYYMNIPIIPNFPSDHKWHFDVFDNDSLKLYFKNINKKNLFLTDVEIYKKYLLTSIVKTQQDIESKEVKIIFSKSTFKSD